MSTYYHKCPVCKANLDPGEKCDCSNTIGKVHFYSKKPEVIQAILWTGKNHADVEKFLTTSNFYYNLNGVEGGLVLKTCFDERFVHIGDYIIKQNSSYYSCSAEVFNNHYQMIHANKQPPYEEKEF